jgi:hypothetical protein
MALTNIVSGELKNKVGAFVGAKWKGKPYVRSYVIPRDAHSDAQVAVRNQFKMVTTFGSNINEGILKAFQAKAVKNQSPYNRFVQINKDVIADESKSYGDIRIFKGSLPTGQGLQCSASAGVQAYSVSFTAHHYGTAKDTDTMIVLVYDETAETYAFGTVARGSQPTPLNVEIPGYFAEGDTLHVYLTACQPKVANGATVSITTTATE